MKKIGAVVAIVAVATMLAVPVASASAVGVYPELPSGSRLVAIDCDSAPNQMWNVDASSGDSVPLGTPVLSLNAGNCSPSGALNPVDGGVYFVEWGTVSDLMRLDPDTGISKKIATLHGDSYASCGIAIDKLGNAFSVTSSTLYSLDLVTGTLEAIGDTGLSQHCAMGINPVDGKLYWMTPQGADVFDAYAVDTATATATLVSTIDGSAVNGGLDMDALAFDSNGIAWALDYDTCSGVESSCWLQPFNPVTGEVWQKQARLNDKTMSIYAENFSGKAHFSSQGLIFLPNEPTTTLPDTGVPAGVLMNGVALLAGLGIVALAWVRSRPKRG